MKIGTISPAHLSWFDAAARVGGALILSLALGLERFIHKKPVDFRPFVIIALASGALTIGIVEFAYRASDPGLSVDPAKVASGIMTGIGFLGAGTIFREQHVVQGAGSAAAIWAAGATDIVCGLGLLWLAGLLSAGVVLTLLLSRPFTDDYTVSTENKDESGSPD